MDTRYLIGIDCGSQSAKVTVHDAAGAVLAAGRHKLRPMSRPSPGTVVHPNDDLWDAIAGATRQALRRFDGDRSRIAGVGLCPIRCCKAFLRADGSLAEPVISWMDDRAYQPYRPDPSARYATTSSGYLAHRFTGVLADTAANNIPLQWPLDPLTWQWRDAADTASYSEFGADAEMLVPLVMPGRVIGPVTADAAASTGIPEGTPVVATANDKAVEFLGAGPVGTTEALVSLGTYICAMVHGHEYRASPTAYWTNFAAVPHRYLYESHGVRRGMWTLTWLLDLLGPEFAAHAERTGHSREQLLEAEAVEVPAGSDGLLTVLDWLAPTDAPFRKGSMLGFDARHTRAHLYRSIMEAIAVSMHQHVDSMCAELTVNLDRIIVSGGGSASPLFMQILADVFGLPASRATKGGGAGLGAAICAAVGTGVHPDFETAAHLMAPPHESFTPAATATALYRNVANRYSDVRGATDPLYQRAADTSP